MARTAQRIARIHKLLGLVIGVQLLLWTVSGLFFTIFPIEVVRGEHLRSEPELAALNTDDLTLHPIEQIAARGAGLTQNVRLKPFVTGPVYEVEASEGFALYNAVTGQRISPINEALARDVALQNWAGRGELVSLDRLKTPPREAGGKGRPAWRAQFKGKDKATFWIDAQTGEVRAVRTGIWRTFDFLWGLHIMDWWGRENFTSPLMKIFAFGGVTMSLLGGALIIDRARKGRLFK